MAVPSLNFQSLLSVDPLSEFQKGQEFSAGERRKSYLRDIGPMLASGDMQGAAQSAFATGDPQMIDTGMQLQNISMERGLKMANFFSEAAQRADTPEKWSKVIEAGRGIFGDKVSEYADFQTGRPNAMTALQKAQLDIQQQTQQRAEAEFRMRQEMQPYDIMLKRAQAAQLLAKAAQQENRVDLTEGQKALDKKYAAEYADFKLGGAADIDKNLQQLREVSAKLKSGASLSGPLTGLMPDWMAATVNPEAVNTRQLVEEVVQRNLRLILGAQFTQKESEQLIARAYNPLLDEKENAKRVGRLIGAMSKAFEAKKAAADYFQVNGTLKGFAGPTSVSMDAIISEFEKDGGEVPRPKTLDEAKQLPPGTVFIDPSGVRRVR